MGDGERSIVTKSEYRSSQVYEHIWVNARIMVSGCVVRLQSLAPNGPPAGITGHVMRIEMRWPSARIPLHEAARRAYEAVEKAGVLDLTTPSQGSPDSKLNHFKLLFMVDDETEVFGVKPPSTKPRLIPKADLQGGHDLILQMGISVNLMT
jgi:hypothetical protein